MSKKVRIKLNSAGINELLHSSELESGLAIVAAAHAGGWESDTKQMPTRVIASIYTTDEQEARDEMDTHRIVGGLR